MSQEVENQTNFRKAEKFYASKPLTSKKAKKNKPAAGVLENQFADVLDFAHPETLDDRVRPIDVPVSTPHQFVAHPVQRYYEVLSVPGLLVIPCPFTIEEQAHWVRRCVFDFSTNNPTNLSNLQLVQLRERQAQGENGVEVTSDRQFRWAEFQPDLVTQLRWASLGYHFQWTDRLYTDKVRDPFPSELADLTRYFAGLVGYDMTAEAAIINYYPDDKGRMGGHLDDAEDAMEMPIVSVSFCNTSVFLIGGRDRAQVPTALFVHSGDVVIMSGESRYCYHGIPRVLANTCPPQLVDCLRAGGGSMQERDPRLNDMCAEYASNARLNMNCRQVRKAQHKHAATSCLNS